MNPSALLSRPHSAGGHAPNWRASAGRVANSYIMPHPKPFPLNLNKTLKCPHPAP